MRSREQILKSCDYRIQPAAEVLLDIRDLLTERVASGVPKPCTGFGTVPADFTVAASSIPSHGQCGICGQSVRLITGEGGLVIGTHPYLPVDAVQVSSESIDREIANGLERAFRSQGGA